MIKKGCNLVTDVSDILNQYKDIKFKKRVQTKKILDIDIPQELADVYKVIDNIPKSISEIAIMVNLPINEVNYKLMALEIENKIKELPGQMFIRKYDE